MENKNKQPIAVVMVGKTHSGKSTFARMDVLAMSKNFTELVIKQREFMTPPTSNESDHFFEIGDVGEIEDLIAEISKIT